MLDRLGIVAGHDDRLAIVGRERAWQLGEKGLLAIADVATWWRRATELMAGRLLPIRATHVTALAALPMLHKDPFDRILIAQAIAEGLALVTNDEHLSDYPLRTIW